MKKTRPPQPKKDALLEHLLRNKPKGGENFWVFSVMMDDPDTPTWDRRFNIVGTYEKNVSCFIAMSHVLAETGQLKDGLKIAMFQGNTLAVSWLTQPHKRPITNKNETLNRTTDDRTRTLENFGPSSRAKRTESSIGA
jgi:hypothetical protein